MKRMTAVILTLMMLLVMGFSMGEGTIEFTEEQLALSPDNQCPVHPQIYSSARYLNMETNSAYDMSNGLSARQINNPSANRMYGLYFKFTPGGKDHGYQIDRFDVVISDNKSGEKLYIDGFAANMKCESGYYWAWNFFPLEGLFENQKTLYGEVKAGVYKMDIYFNGLWAGNTVFKIGN